MFQRQKRNEERRKGRKSKLFSSKSFFEKNKMKKTTESMKRNWKVKKNFEKIERNQKEKNNIREKRRNGKRFRSFLHSVKDFFSFSKK